MMSFQTLLSNLQLPSSAELMALTMHDSAFAKRTRYLKTSSNTFQVSQKQLAQGTWSFTSIEKTFPVVRDACARIATLTNKRVQCNAYFTPPGAQGLPVHYDLHDVLVLQTEGSKKWKIWSAFRKNVSIKTLLLDERENLPVWTSTSPAKELQLEKNQTLYLTKGEPHVAVTTSEDSLHFSFGIYHD